MNIIREITLDSVYKGIYKLAVINNKYWWLYHYCEGKIKYISISGREIIDEWGTEEQIEFRDEDLYDN